MSSSQRHVSLLWRVLLSTSIAITLLFGALGWLIQDQFTRSAEDSIEQEVRASFQAYESLWRAELNELASVSRVLSRMPDIRAAFGTNDRATILDTASEAWDQVQESGSLLFVTTPGGAVIAPVAGPKVTELSFVPAASKSFPAQARGFVTLDGHLFQIVVTPVFVASTQSAALLNVLVAGIAVDSDHVSRLKNATGGSDFAFVAGSQLAASTLPDAARKEFFQTPGSGRLRLANEEYYGSAFTLSDLEGREVGRLSILRSFEAVSKQILSVRWRLVAMWIPAMLLGLIATYWLTRRLLQPLQQLDAAAAEIGRGNYRVQVPVQGSGEIARLTESFNTMSDSLTQARQDLIQQERISTIGRLSTSIIHDLRNPLAAIYGGSEMLVDHNLSPNQVQRLASNIYRASRRVQNMLQELADINQGRAHAREQCKLREVVEAAYEPLANVAEAQGVEVSLDVPADVELPLDRAPMERVFQNLIANAIEALPEGGAVRVSALASRSEVMASVEDTGPGIPPSIEANLFEPFVTAGKKNGVGLGLALAKKTVLSHGGDLWLERLNPGSRFKMRLPV